jgi:manganese/zinc/iron transport system permease protein
LESFINGKTASMLTEDARLIAIAAAVIAAVCVVLFKEFALLCFDADYAASLGRPVLLLDGLMMALVVAVTVIGLQAVGLILMIALLIIPPAAARFWTNHLPTMIVLAAGIGAAGGLVGATLSALIPRLPAGAVIVVATGAGFLLSLVLGPARGVLARVLARLRSRRAILHQHLLRALYELGETHGPSAESAEVSWNALLRCRSWSPGGLRRAVRRARRAALVTVNGTQQRCRLTDHGLAAAWRIVRNHRLWELFLITHADVAPSHVDRDADEVEHVLEAHMIRELESLLADRHPDLVRPPSPHRLDGAGLAAVNG